MQFCLFVEGMRAKHAKESRQSLFRAQELRDSVLAGRGLIRFGTSLERDGSASSTGGEAGLLFTGRLAVELVWLQA